MESACSYSVYETDCNEAPTN